MDGVDVDVDFEVAAADFVELWSSSSSYRRDGGDEGIVVVVVAAAAVVLHESASGLDFRGRLGIWEVSLGGL